MIKAFAPRELGGCSWVLLSIALIGGFPLVVRSQTSAPKNDAGGQNPPNADAKADAGAGEKRADQGPGSVVTEADKKPVPQVEIFRDPRAEKLLAQPLANFKQMGRLARPPVIRAVKEMAANQVGNIDRAAIEQYVDHMIAELTSHTNLRAVVEPNAAPPTSHSNVAIKEATSDLIEPILSARAAGNNNFLKAYNQVLLQKLEPLLSGHLLSRIEAMIVLSQAANPDAVPVFIKQLIDPNQTLWVDLWALRGLTSIQTNPTNRFNLDTLRATQAAKAVSDFLDREKDLPWWLQYRALEALGSLRQASMPARQAPDMASTATQFLTDPDARLEVRAEAGWALGMMQVPGAIPDFNYAMIAYSLGDVAAALGERAREAFPNNPIQARLYATLLISQVYQAFEGVDNARESGLLKVNHPSANQARTFIREVSDRTKPIAAAAVKLVRDPAGQAQKNQADLEGKVKALRAWLQKNPPASASLIPNGPKFPVNGAQVVNAPGGAAHVANGPAAGHGR